MDGTPEMLLAIDPPPQGYLIRLVRSLTFVSLPGRLHLASDPL